MRFWLVHVYRIYMDPKLHVSPSCASIAIRTKPQHLFNDSKRQRKQHAQVQQKQKKKKPLSYSTPKHNQPQDKQELVHATNLLPRWHPWFSPNTTWFSSLNSTSHSHSLLFLQISSNTNTNTHTYINQAKKDSTNTSLLIQYFQTQHVEGRHQQRWWQQHWHHLVTCLWHVPVCAMRAVLPCRLSISLLFLWCSCACS